MSSGKPLNGAKKAKFFNLVTRKEKEQEQRLLETYKNLFQHERNLVNTRKYH